jgi:hypothetical protein
MANPSKGGDAKPRVYNHARRDHDSQVAEEKFLYSIFASLVYHQARFLEPYHSFDKGKPAERRRRKAKDLKSRQA